MNIQSQSQSISDDQELAKVLAGVNGEADEAADTPTTDPQPVAPPTPMPSAPASDDDAQSGAPTPSMADLETSGVAPTMPPTPPSPGDSNLDNIKQQALGELRPLVDKLDVSPEERFDTYLLLLRSTDDKELVAPAHEAAKAITDEARRAQALLDIIKEIDFLSSPQPE